MDTRIKELIAIGASVTANCQPCLRYHITRALENGADEQEILEAITVARMVRKGAGDKMDSFVSTQLKAARTIVDTSEKGCGCG